MVIQTFILMVILALVPRFSAESRNENFDRDIQKNFSGTGIQPRIGYIESPGLKLRYVEVNEAQTGAPAVVFVHGAPGSWDAFSSYLKNRDLNQCALLISLDRAGYGGSRETGPVTKMHAQAEAIAPLIARLKSEGRKVVLVGHSYGGPVIAKIAMDMPNEVDGLLLLAAAIDPKHEKIFWFSKLGIVAPTRWFTPSSMRIASYEKMAHVEALVEIENDWFKINCPVVCMHGDKDVLVPFENLSFAEKHIRKDLFTPIHLKGENHFIPWSRKSEVTAIIQQLIN